MFVMHRKMHRRYGAASNNQSDVLSDSDSLTLLGSEQHSYDKNSRSTMSGPLFNKQSFRKALRQACVCSGENPADRSAEDGMIGISGPHSEFAAHAGPCDYQDPVRVSQNLILTFCCFDFSKLGSKSLGLTSVVRTRRCKLLQTNKTHVRLFLSMATSTRDSAASLHREIRVGNFI